MEYGTWFADFEGVIKRPMIDEDGNHAGYQLLDGEYPEEWRKPLWDRYPGKMHKVEREFTAT